MNISVGPNSPRVLQFVPPLSSYGSVEDETYLVSLRSLEAKVCFLVSPLVKNSVVDPDPHPDPDPYNAYVFGPPGSASVPLVTITDPDPHPDPAPDPSIIKQK